MLSRVLKEVKLPFPNDFFPEMTVSTQLRNDLQRTASQLLNQTLDEELPLARFHPNQEPDQWKRIGDRNGLQLYRERNFTKGNAVQMKVLGQMNGTLEDVMLALYASTSGALKTQRAIMHNAYLDAAVLHVLEEDLYSEHDTSFSYRFEGIKWLACAPTGKLMHKRDLCWYEQLGRTQDINGDEVGYLVMQSVRVDGCPPFEQQGLTRSSAVVCYIFRPLSNNRMEVYMNGKHAVGGKSRSWSADSIMIELWLGVANALECASTKRLSNLVSGKEVLTISAMSKTCNICDSKFKLLTTNQNCKICGKSVCNRCRTIKMVYPSRNTGSFPCNFFFCKPCLNDAKKQLYGCSAARASFHCQDSSAQPEFYQSGLLQHTGSHLTGQSELSIMSSSSEPTRSRRQRVQHDQTGLVMTPAVREFAAYLSSPCRSPSSYSSAQTTVSSAPSMSPHYSTSSMNPGARCNGAQRMRAYQLRTGRLSVRPVENRAAAGPPRMQRTTSNSMRRKEPPRTNNSSRTSDHQDVEILGNKSTNDSRYMFKQPVSCIYDVGENETSCDHEFTSDDSDMSEYEEGAHVTILSSRQNDRATIYDAADVDIIEINRESDSGRHLSSEPEPVDMLEKAKPFRSNRTALRPADGATTFSTGMTEQAKFMERLIQINMTAEATYLMTKYNSSIHGNSLQ